MYRFFRRDREQLKHAQDLAEMQLAQLIHHRSDISPDEASAFLAREVLRLNREGENDVQRLANRAISAFREHIQKRESALRLTSQPD